MSHGGTNSQDAYDWNYKANRLKMAGDLEGAFEGYKKSLSYDPMFAEAWVNMGILLAGVGQFEDAEKAISTALEIEPDHPFALGSMAAVIMFDKDRQREAESLLQRALQIQPTNSENWHHLGFLQSMTNPEQAEASFRKSLELNPENPRTYVDFAIMLHKAERFVEAEDMARRATEMRPKDRHAWNQLAKALYALGRVRDGINAQVEATDVAPDDPYQWELLSFMYLDAGYLKRAEGSLKKWISLDMENLEAWEKLFDLHREIGDVEGLRESESMFRMIAKGRPKLEEQVGLMVPEYSEK